MRLAFSLVLALMLALTSQSMAVARGAAAATDKITLCTGTGPMAVYVDAEGNPTQAPHLCPDSTLHVVFDVDPPRADVPLDIVLHRAASLPAVDAPRVVAPVRPPSRAPPSVV